MPCPDRTFTCWKPASLLARRLVDLPLTDAGDTVKRSFAEVATVRQRLFVWLLDRIYDSSGLRRSLPRLSGRRHNSWRSAR
jgi:heme oxygenase